MESTGIYRRMDSLGRFVLPKELRRTLDINQDDYLEILLEGDTVMLRKAQQKCILCGAEETAEEKFAMLHGKKVCKNCMQEMKDM